MPLASRFDYLLLPEYLQTLIVFRVETNPFDLRYEFNGSHLTHLFGGEVTGKSLREITAETNDDPEGNAFASRSLKMMHLCFAERRPVLVGPKRIPLTERSFILFESLSVPFVDRTGAVTRLVSLVDIKNL